MEAEIMHVLTETLWLTTKLAAPVLLVSLTIGVVIGMFQTVVSVQEATLTFVPKLMGVAAVLVLGGSWMLNELSDFFIDMMAMAPDLVRM